jgi:hypothetical protein
MWNQIRPKMPKQFWVILSVLSSVILSKLLDTTNMARNKSEPFKPCDTPTGYMSHWTCLAVATRRYVLCRSCRWIHWITSSFKQDVTAAMTQKRGPHITAFVKSIRRVLNLAHSVWKQLAGSVLSVCPFAAQINVQVEDQMYIGHEDIRTSDNGHCKCLLDPASI